MAGRTFTMVATTIWRSERFLTVSDEAKVLYFYYLTSEHQNSAGAYRILDGYACTDLRCDLKQYKRNRDELIKAELVAFDPGTSEVYLLRWFQHCRPKGAKQEAGTRRMIAAIESDVIRELVERDWTATEPPAENVHRLTSTEYMGGRR